MFGPETERAVRAVQRKHGLPPTGVADAQTDQVITSAASAEVVATRGTAAAADPKSSAWS